MSTTFTQPPDAILPYVVDWTAWLEGGETIATATWAVECGLQIMSTSLTTTAATVYLRTIGALGSKDKVSCTITSTASPAKRDTRVFYVKTAEV